MNCTHLSGVAIRCLAGWLPVLVKLVVKSGIGPPTQRFSVSCSTIGATSPKSGAGGNQTPIRGNQTLTHVSETWALFIKRQHLKLASLTGVEPAFIPIMHLTGRNRRHYRDIKLVAWGGFEPPKPYGNWVTASPL